MVSRSLQSSLEREIVGQRRAVSTLTRVVTVALSGVDSRTPLGIYLLVGPTGTGKTHLARVMAKILHGDSSRVAVVDCSAFEDAREWQTLSQQVAPHFRQGTGPHGSVAALAPLSILLVEHLERARAEFARALLGAIEAGFLALPGGEVGSLGGCLVIMTSNLCAREIYAADRPEIGFSSTAEDMAESEKARIFQLCSVAAEKRWGSEFLAHVDDLIVFHRLREAHLPLILNRLVDELGAHLAARGLSCELRPGAVDLVCGRATNFLQQGAWAMIKVFRRFVLFPIADLVQSGKIAAGSRIVVDADGKTQLRFETVAERTAPSAQREARRVAIPVR